MTHGNQVAKTIFNVELNGENASTHVTSRSVATEDSIQEFVSEIVGDQRCFGHVECDGMLLDNAQISSLPIALKFSFITFDVL